jgi:ribonuclease BN (tRNA processing enzyme)
VTLTITLLGTGSPIPSPDRAGPATLISAGSGIDAEHYLVDAGRGVLMRLVALGLGAPNLSAVLITHLHSDHITDLNDVITTRWVMTLQPTPLTIVGPVGTRRFVDYEGAAVVAAQTAQRAGLDTLVLTHYVPPIPAGSDGDDWRALAAAHFHGTIELGDDLHRVDIEAPNSTSGD